MESAFPSGVAHGAPLFCLLDPIMSNIHGWEHGKLATLMNGPPGQE